MSETSKYLVRMLRFALPAFMFGVAIHFIGFGDFAEVHRMFSLEDPRLILTFAVAVAVTGLAIHVARPRERKQLGRGKLHPGIIPGAVLFGIGWALTGACPGVVMVQIGEGQLLALVTLVGVLAGNLIYGRVHRRFLRWDTGSCDIG
jgi:hypothetical protein